MPSSAYPATPRPNNLPQSSKRMASDAESASKDPKKARRNSAEPSTRHDSTRDTKRRRRRKRKAPLVSTGTTNNQGTQSQLDERSRAPLSARNEVIRFTSIPPDADLPASSTSATRSSSQAPSSKLLGKSQESSSHTLDYMPSTLKDETQSVSVDRGIYEPSVSSLGDRFAQLEAELKSKDKLITSHQTLLNQVQQAVTCQVCLDLMYKPYALAPCGHLACHSCLANWFTAPPPDNRPATPAVMRKKTCPHCRAVVRERPVEVWGVKSIAYAMGKSGLLSNQLPVPVDASENLDANADPWKDIFPKPGSASYRGIPWFFPDTDMDADIQSIQVPPHMEDFGMLDTEDGGIYRCLDCMHEIWDGVCTNCRRVYPGHRVEGDDEDEGDPMGWLEDQMGAEEVDVVDDPSWMGLEDGEADDDGDIDDWHPFAPWRHHVFRGSWGFVGAVHVEEDEEDEDEIEDRVVEVLDEDAESGDDDYESSFIDDNDEGGIVNLEDRPRIYEIGDNDEDEDYRPNRRARIVDSVSDDHGEDEFGTTERRWYGHGHALVVSSGEEEAGDRDGMIPSIRGSHSRRQRRGRGIVESDHSDTS